MKSCSAALANFMENATTAFRVDLYTITLQGGAVLRWSGSTIPVEASIQVNQQPAGPYTWILGPPISDAGVQNSRGIQPGTVDINIYCGDGRFTVAGKDVRDFVFGLGLDGATVRIDRAYAASFSDMATVGPVGTFCRFSGRVSEPKELGQSQVVVTCTDWRDCLNTEYPKVGYQSSCNNTFGDANCGVDLASLTKSATVSVASSATNVVQSAIVAADDEFDLGTVTFTSGINAGIARSVKSTVLASDSITTTAPFPSVPQAGDAFNVCPGCALSIAACTSFQGAVPSGVPAMQRFLATPFVPPPSTGLPT
ncbi:MAG: DUF2163 domain-containing protein [Caulobacteraceae bacterium]